MQLIAAKNLVLAGVKSVTLHDEGLVELWDLSSNFIFAENDIGKNRALASVQKLQELNNAVLVTALTTKLAKEQLSDFQVIFLFIVIITCLSNPPSNCNPPVFWLVCFYLLIFS